MARKFGAELLGTAILVFFGAGIAALVFGFRIFGASLAAGLVAIGIVFWLVYTALAYVIGPISGAHVNPAVTLGAFLTRRISAFELGYYWLAQLIGSLLGALVLWWVLSTSPFYSRSRIGLGANGYGGNSVLHIGGGGAFLAEVVLTAVFVLVALALSAKGVAPAVTALGIGIGLGLTNLLGSAFDGASINPARSFGPAVIGGGSPLSQLWVFLLAPLVGGLLAAGVYQLLHPESGGLRGVEEALGAGGGAGAARYGAGQRVGAGQHGGDGTWHNGEGGRAGVADGGTHAGATGASATASHPGGERRGWEPHPGGQAPPREVHEEPERGTYHVPGLREIFRRR